MSGASTTEEMDVRTSRGRARGWMRVAVEFVVAVLLQIAVMDFHAWTSDESLLQYGALRVMHGLLPYRDFWTLYPPGGYYTLAAAFHVFGVNALSDRVVFVVSNAISAIAIVFLLDRLTERWWLSRVAAAATLLWMCAWAAYALPVYPSVAMILLAMACMLRRWEGGGARWALWAGVALGVAALFRHDLAVFALIALGAASVVDRFWRCEVHGGFAGADVVRMCCTMAVVVVPVALWMVINIPAHELSSDMISFPEEMYAKVRSLPFPNAAQVLHGFLHPHTTDEPALGTIEYNVVWLPMIAALAAMPVIVTGMRGGRSWRWTGVLALTLMTVLMFLAGVVRVSPVQMVPGVVAAFVLLACLCARLRRTGVAVRVAVLVAVAWGSVCVLASLHTDYLEFRSNVRMMRGTAGNGVTFAALCHPPAGLERARCMILPNDERQAILFLESESTPEDRIFVGQPRYDVMRAGDVPFYFYSGREAATRWYDLEPGVETGAPIQNDMVCDIERNRTRYVVRDDAPLELEANESRVSSGVDVLGQYIARNYVLQRRFGEIAVLMRSTAFAAPGVYCNG